ncbi:hypothetical protein BH11PLA1_BH11PLA1_16790 [soil metagenome]
MDSPHVMQCSEVWGGNGEVRRGVAMQGLDAWVLSIPHDGEAAGGDIHYVSSCGSGRITRVLIADVAGHGASVAELAVRLRNVMRRFVNFVDQTRLVGVINTEFAGFTEGGRFATAVVATFWGPTGDLDITNAGHPTPLVFRSETRRWSLLERDEQTKKSRREMKKGAAHAEADNFPLGIADAATYGRSTVRLRPGDLVLLYTDALVEARGVSGVDWGMEGLRAAAEKLTTAGVGAENILDGILDAARMYSGCQALGDDTTMLLLRLNAETRPRAGLRMAAGSAWRIVKNVVLAALGQEKMALPEVRADNVLGVLLERFNARQ